MDDSVGVTILLAADIAKALEHPAGRDAAGRVLSGLPKDDNYRSSPLPGAGCIVSSDLRHLVAMHPWRGIPLPSPSDYLALP